MVIYLDRPSPDGSSGLPGSRRAALCFLFGLASSGVCMCPPCYHWGGSLLHCLSTLTCFHAVYFCCTVPEVAFAGRYPAPCPLKPGLSSPASLRTAAATICLTQNLFILAYIYFDVQTCVYIFSLRLLQIMSIWMHTPMKIPQKKADTTTHSDSFPR